MTTDSLPPVEFSRRDCRVIDNVLDHVADGDEWQRLRTRVSDVNTKLAKKTDHRHREDTRRRVRKHDLTTYDLRKIRHAIERIFSDGEYTKVAESEDMVEAARFLKELHRHLSSLISAMNSPRAH